MRFSTAHSTIVIAVGGNGLLDQGSGTRSMSSPSFHVRPHPHACR